MQNVIILQNPHYSSMMSPFLLEEILLMPGYDPDPFSHEVLQVDGTTQSHNTFGVW